MKKKNEHVIRTWEWGEKTYERSTKINIKMEKDVVIWQYNEKKN